MSYSQAECWRWASKNSWVTEKNDFVLELMDAIENNQKSIEE